MNKNLLFFLISGIAILISGFLISYAGHGGWHAPVVNPPNTTGTEAPIATSTIGQSKIGGLYLNQSGLSTYGLRVLNGNVGIGTASPSEKLDLAGNMRISGYIKTPLFAASNNQILVATTSYPGYPGYNPSNPNIMDWVNRYLWISISASTSWTGTPQPPPPSPNCTGLPIPAGCSSIGSDWEESNLVCVQLQSGASNAWIRNCFNPRLGI